MIGVYTQTVKRTEFKRTNNQYYGGYKAYWKLVRQLIQLYNTTKVPKGFKYYWTIFYASCLKPLGCLIAHKTVKEGDVAVTFRNEEYVSRTEHKQCMYYRTYYFCKVPIWWTIRNMTKEEILEIVNDKK